MKKLAVVLCISLMAFVLIGCAGDDAGEDAAEETAAAEVNVADVADGTYDGVGEGNGGDVELEVTVADGEITDIAIGDHDETEGIADPAFDEVPAAIIDAQSTDVDAASGATYSSEAIMEAVADALAN
ncbi:FMN-binding protein [Natroniella sulfidigena]|uniref:FMN-binding protein n=1 Tax=Natroniella sulfidigena TaxID=723921 RepID=UPI002009F1F2|nr:FMN-binding protein [Natroniella sulfidigena]MCK8816091.1 FMN-binding protein [Natroniella sulfidigena]